eukprot:758503-Hanusia_phi.AAC.3
MTPARYPIARMRRGAPMKMTPERQECPNSAQSTHGSGSPKMTATLLLASARGPFSSFSRS